jgi:transposase
MSSKFTNKSLKLLKFDLENRDTTYRNLAKKYNVHEVTIRRYNKQFGFARVPIDRNGIKDDLRTGLYTKEQLAEKYKVTPKTIYNIKREWVK